MGPWLSVFPFWKMESVVSLVGIFGAKIPAESSSLLVWLSSLFLLIHVPRPEQTQPNTPQFRRLRNDSSCLQYVTEVFLDTQRCLWGELPARASSAPGWASFVTRKLRPFGVRKGWGWGGGCLLQVHQQHWAVTHSLSALWKTH